ncbi:hypothetical protein AC249_AIPGENE2421, partial [Exaiptasia diaphana]
WIEGVYGLINPDRVAIVFHHRVYEEGLETRLLERLRNPVNVSLQLVRSCNSPANEGLSRAALDFMRSEKTISPSVCLASWLWRLIDSGLIDSRMLGSHSPVLESWLKQLDGPSKEAAMAASGPDERELVAALVRLPADEDLMADVVALALSLENAPAFVRASAGASAAIRLATLKGSVASEAGRSDTLVDAWLDGHSLEPKNMPHGADLVAHPTEVAEPLALGLMRRLVTNSGERDRIKACWKGLENRLRPHIRATWAAFEDVSVRKRLLSSRRACAAAFRSGLVQLYPIHLSEELLADLDIYSWWLLQTQPPKQEQLRVVLSLGPSRRAVIGLNTR